MENAVRVLVANRPRLLREMVMSALAEQEGIDVVGEADDERDVPEMVARTKPSEEGLLEVIRKKDALPGGRIS